MSYLYLKGLNFKVFHSQIIFQINLNKVMRNLFLFSRNSHQIILTNLFQLKTCDSNLIVNAFLKGILGEFFLYFFQIIIS